MKIKLLGNGISKIKVKKDKPENGEPGEEKTRTDKKRKILTLSSKNAELNGAAPIKPAKITIRKADIKIK